LYGNHHTFVYVVRNVTIWETWKTAICYMQWKQDEQTDKYISYQIKLRIRSNQPDIS